MIETVSAVMGLVSEGIFWPMPSKDFVPEPEIRA